MNTNLASALLIAICVHLGASQSKGFASLGGMPLALQSLQGARGLTTNTFPGSLPGNFPGSMPGNFPGTFKSASNTNKDFWPGPAAYPPMPIDNTIYPDLSTMMLLQSLRRPQPQQRRTSMSSWGSKNMWPLVMGMEEEMMLPFMMMNHL